MRFSAWMCFSLSFFQRLDGQKSEYHIRLPLGRIGGGVAELAVGNAHDGERRIDVRRFR